MHSLRTDVQDMRRSKHCLQTTSSRPSVPCHCLPTLPAPSPGVVQMIFLFQYGLLRNRSSATGFPSGKLAWIGMTARSPAICISVKNSFVPCLRPNGCLLLAPWKTVCVECHCINCLSTSFLLISFLCWDMLQNALTEILLMETSCSRITGWMFRMSGVIFHCPQLRKKYQTRSLPLCFDSALV